MGWKKFAETEKARQVKMTVKVMLTIVFDIENSYVRGKQ
jgi:hypothetical protein